MTEIVPIAPKLSNAKGNTHILINSENGTENHTITLRPEDKLVLYVAMVQENGNA